MSLIPAKSIAAWLPPALREAPGPGVGPLSSARLLDALLAAVDTQYHLLAGDVDQVWEDLFIESCAPWAVPYLATLVGLPTEAERAEVAYTIALRRRKGTPGALRDFAEVLTGLSARVVEGWQVTLWCQRLGYPPPPRTAALSLKDVAKSRVGTPFERARRSFTPGGSFDPAAATAVVWPWRVFTYQGTEAARVVLKGAPAVFRYALHPFGIPAPLYLRPRPLSLSAEELPAGSAARPLDETDAPVRVTSRLIQALSGPGDTKYGGTWLLAPSHPLAGSGAAAPPALGLTVGGKVVPWSSLRFGPLAPDGAATFPPAHDEAVVDVDRGMVELGSDLVAGGGKVHAVWHRPAPGAAGALASDIREDLGARVVVTVSSQGTSPNDLDAAITSALNQVSASGLVTDPRSNRPDVEIRLETSDRLVVPTTTKIQSALRWRIVASIMATPTLVGDLVIDLNPGGTLSLEGFYLSGSLWIGPDANEIHLRNITMDPTRGASISVQSGGSATSVGTALRAERCLLAPIRAGLGTSLTLADCVVDGRGHRLGAASAGGPAAAGRPAVAAPAGARFGPDLNATGVTFAGLVQVDAVEAVDCLFADGIQVVQLQQGCIRHCYLGPSPALGSLPPAYRCGPFPAPTFSSEAFEAAGYYALELNSDHPLLSAAADGGEVGAYHHARRATHLDALRRRIHEFVPLGINPQVALAPWEE